MKLSDNTILITGGGSGIGRGPAEAFHALGNRVIIAGCRNHVLNEVTDANPGMNSVTLDIDDPEAIRSFTEEVLGLHPSLNVLINNAGIMRPENLRAQQVARCPSHHHHEPAGMSASPRHFCPISRSSRVPRS